MTRSALIKAALLLAGTLTVMASAVMAPALPSIEAAFADTPGAGFLTKMILSGPALVIVLAAPLAGQLADRWDRRPLLLAGLTLYALGGTSGGFANSLAFILAGRAVLGLGVAAIMTASIALIADYFEGPERARLLGLQQAFSHGGAIFLQVFSGALADVTWRAPFYSYGISIGLLILSFFVIGEPARHAPAPAGGPQPAETAAPARRIMMLVIFATAMIVMVCFYMIPVQLAFFLEPMTGGRAILAGLAIAWMSVCATAGSLAYPRIRQRIGHVRVVIVMALMMGTGFTIFGLAGSYPFVLAGLMVTGLGFGLILPNQAGWLTDIAPQATRGRAVGGLTLAVFLGQFISTPAVQPLIAATSYGTAFVCAGGVLFALGAAYLAARGKLRRLTEAAAS